MRSARPAARRALAVGAACVVQAVLAGCTFNGDFDRLRPSLVTEDMHAWVGIEAAEQNGVPPSTYPLTDDERLLRDLAFALIEAPYDRNRWFSIVYEYGLTRVFQPQWMPWDIPAYARHLLNKPYRSPTARYDKLNDDVRNDVVRIPPFFDVARRVIDIDHTREKSFAFIPSLAPGDIANARARIAENIFVVGWVQCSLAYRAASYQFTLERLLVGTPSQMAVEVERSLALMRQSAAENEAVPGPAFCGAPPIGGVAGSRGRLVSKG